MGAASEVFGSSSSLAAADDDGWHDADEAMSQEVTCPTVHMHVSDLCMSSSDGLA